jgi:hypothetical protein
MVERLELVQNVVDDRFSCPKSEGISGFVSWLIFLLMMCGTAASPF